MSVVQQLAPAVNSIDVSLSLKADLTLLDDLRQQLDNRVTSGTLSTTLHAYALQTSVQQQVATSANSTLATVASTYALKTQVDQLASELSSKATPAAIATALIPYSTSEKVDTDIQLAIANLQADLLTIQTLNGILTAYASGDTVDALQSSVDAILARLGDSSSALASAPPWDGEVTFSLLQGNVDLPTLLRLHVQADTPLSLSLANDGQALSLGRNAHSREEIATLLQPLSTQEYVDQQIATTNRNEVFYTSRLVFESFNVADRLQIVGERIELGAGALEIDESTGVHCQRTFSVLETVMVVTADSVSITVPVICSGGFTVEGSADAVTIPGLTDVVPQLSSRVSALELRVDACICRWTPHAD